MKVFFLHFLILFGIHVNCDAITVHIFGDSNALFNFSNIVMEVPKPLNYSCEQIHIYEDINIPVCINGFVGKTMHGVSKEGFLDLRSYNVTDDDIAVFAFGCVDVYFHVAKQRDLYCREVDEILDTLVNQYLSCVVKNKNLYHNLRCVITSVLPPYTGIEGNLKDKVDITIKLNEKLQMACVEKEILYLDIHGMFVTKEGFLDPTKSDGAHHVAMKNNFPIRKKLIQLLGFE